MGPERPAMLGGSTNLPLQPDLSGLQRGQCLSQVKAIDLDGLFSSLSALVMSCCFLSFHTAVMACWHRPQS